MNIALGLTISRIILCPLFLLIYLYPKLFGLSEFYALITLLSLAVFFELSDLFDGMIARNFGQVTPLGQLLDPMADSLTRTSIFLVFTQGPVSLPIILPILLIYRDVLVGYLRSLVALNGKALAARRSGKVKAVLQGLTILVILVLIGLYYKGYVSLLLLQSLSFWILTPVTIYSAISGLEYFSYHWPEIRKTFRIIKSDSEIHS